MLSSGITTPCGNTSRASAVCAPCEGEHANEVTCTKYMSAVDTAASVILICMRSRSPMHLTSKDGFRGRPRPWGAPFGIWHIASRFVVSALQLASSLDALLGFPATPHIGYSSCAQNSYESRGARNGSRENLHAQHNSVLARWGGGKSSNEAMAQARPQARPQVQPLPPFQCLPS